ncbi:heterokaryon incompatibility protein-domain-containing protein [Ampelomyces quisqualis]|uniref:Heterokaryon incompatibility protein-domain-containing protein n=1 Tax=Ampelomyces quisqualis TaxID=50730 RepID=A0A6A5Q7U3_AMPQU|nr:heterokaryon incompatibility protein-domain-containing protein [Ampelomyces quisqualis]
MPEPLAYNELQHNEIRLIELLPDAWDAQLGCRLFTVSLDNPPAFESLSYVWGDPSITKTITCNGHDMEVTVNLANALQRLRGQVQGSSRLVWVDALCINQSSVSEKNVQVPLMREIYSGATGVAVWLGLEETGSFLTAVAAIEYVSSAFSTLEEAGVKATDHLEFSDVEEQIKEQGLTDVWNSLNNFFSIPYWERVWCVQEVSLAQRASFLVGSRELLKQDIANFTNWYIRRFVNEIEKGPDFDQTMKPGTVFKACAMLNFTEWSASGNEDLCATLDTFKRSRATNLRDKVYGLLGTFTQRSGKQAAIAVDYSKTVAQVYTDTVFHAFAETGTLKALSYVEHGRQYDADPEIPSWVPRWDRVETMGYQKLLISNTPLSASRNGVNNTPQACPTMGVLPLQGIAFDHVLMTSSILPGVSWLEKDCEFKHLFSQMWSEANGARSTFPHRVSAIELATTLTGGLSSFEDGSSIEINIVVEDIDSVLGRRFLSDFYSFVQAMQLPVSGHDSSEGHAWLYSRQAGAISGTRRIFRTFRGHIGLGPGCMQAGDVVTVLDGGKVPYVLRHLTGSKHAFMSECFVYAIRNGEAYDMREEDGVKRQIFELH